MGEYSERRAAGSGRERERRGQKAEGRRLGAALCDLTSALSILPAARCSPPACLYASARGISIADAVSPAA